MSLPKKRQKRTKKRTASKSTSKKKTVTAFHGTSSAVLAKIEKSGRVKGFFDTTMMTCPEYAFRHAKRHDSEPIVIEANIPVDKFEASWMAQTQKQLKGYSFTSVLDNVRFKTEVVAIWRFDKKKGEWVRHSQPLKKKTAQSKFKRSERVVGQDYKVIDSPSEVDSPMKVNWEGKDGEKTRLRQAYRTGGTSPKLVAMSPSEFLRISPIQKQHVSKKSLARIRKGIKEGVTFGNVPYIVLGFNGDVRGHEGRHRALVLKEMNVKEMPVAIVREYR